MVIGAEQGGQVPVLAGPSSNRAPHTDGGPDDTTLAQRLRQELATLGLGPEEQYSTIADRGDFDLTEHGSTAAAVLLSRRPRPLPRTGSEAEWWEYGSRGGPNLHLTPDGDIPVTADEGDNPTFSFAPFAEADPAIRLSSGYARSIARATRIFHLAPAVPSPHSTPLNLEHLQQRALVLYSSCTKEVMANFGTVVCKFLEFCDAQNTPVPPEKRLPAGPDLVEGFLCSFAGKVTADTVRKYYNGVRTWHAIYGYDVALSDVVARRCFRGIQRLEENKGEERPPASWKDLVAIYTALDHNNNTDTCFWAATATAFFGMTRPGAVTLPTLSSFLRKRYTTSDRVRFVAGTRDFPEHMTVHLPWSKVRGWKGETVTIVHQTTDDRLDPLSAMRNHLRLNRVGSDDFLFSSPDWNNPGTLRPLTYSAFTKRINGILTRAGRRKLSGHSWRIGGSTFYLLAGVNPEIIKKCGNWSSDAYLRYWRNVSIVAAQNLMDAPLVDVADDT
ncbi:hypothetical protein JCM1841_001213 [Sporobolomyces salmonicolor]